MNAVKMKDYFFLAEVEVVISQMMELCLWVRNPEVNLCVSLMSFCGAPCLYLSFDKSFICQRDTSCYQDAGHDLSFTVAYAML